MDHARVPSLNENVQQNANVLDVETKTQQRIPNADAALARVTKTTPHPVMTNSGVEKRSVHASHKAVLVQRNVVASTAEMTLE